MNLIEEMIGQEVVLDAASMYVFLGRVDSFDHRYVVLTEADVHDLRDSTTTRERYVIEARMHGVRPNRKKVIVDLSQIVSISPLEAVID